MVHSWKFIHNEKTLDMTVLKDALETYCYSTGISVSAIDEKGSIVSSCGEHAEFCNLFKECSGGESACRRAHLYAGKQSEMIGEGYIFFCPAGLVHYAAPIIKDNVFKGAIIAGPILMDYPDETSVDEIVLKAKISSNMKDKALSYLKSLPVVETFKVRYLNKLLFTTACSLTSEEKSDIRERNKKMHQQAEIGESIHSIKNNPQPQNAYSYDKEKDLLVKVQNGDELGAKAILNDLLGCIFFTDGGNIEIIKTRCIELCTLLSRAAADGGAAPDEMFGMNYKFIGELSSIDNIEDLSYWTLRVLHKFTENVFGFTSLKNVKVIKKAVNYINENYMNDISLSSVAEYVHLNPSYFSTLFKRETGMNFSDYLNKVRIEESKELLKDGGHSILQISIDVGFENQSYFSKVFKKITGLTPKQYMENKMLA